MAAQRTIVLSLSYRGEPFSGFARQPGLLTVQGDIERALTTALRTTVEVVGAGRTDAGVHARRQCVSFSLPEGVDLDPHSVMRSLNALTHEALSVLSVEEAGAGFSARFDAQSREYRYRIVTGPAGPQFLADFAWWHRAALDVEAMRLAAAHLEGEHDFTSFCSTESLEKTSSPHRFIESIELVSGHHLGESCLEVRVVGNAFLHHMVRIVVGTLVEVGVGRREPEWVAQVLAARDRSAAGPTAPAHGLTFHSVAYPKGALTRLAP